MTIRSRARLQAQRVHAELVRINPTSNVGGCLDIRNHDDKPQRDDAWYVANAKRNLST